MGQTRIRIRWPAGELTAALDTTKTTDRLLAALPCEARANTWGEEVYFSIPVSAALEPDARQVVEPDRMFLGGRQLPSIAVWTNSGLTWLRMPAGCQGERSRNA